MKKNSFKIIILVIFIILLIGVFYYIIKFDKVNEPDDVVFSETTVEENIINNEGDQDVGIVTEDLPGNSETDSSLVEPAQEMPFPGIDGLGLEFMSDEEKSNLSLSPRVKVQILSRNSDGSIASYKIIRQLEDIIYPN